MILLRRKVGDEVEDDIIAPGEGKFSRRRLGFALPLVVFIAVGVGKAESLFEDGNEDILPSLSARIAGRDGVEDDDALKLASAG